MNKFAYLASLKESSTSVYEFLNQHTEQPVSYIDMYVAADLLQTPIVLFRQTSKSMPLVVLIDVNTNDNEDTGNAIILCLKVNDMDRTVTFFPVVWYMKDLAEINDTLTSSNGEEV